MTDEPEVPPNPWQVTIRPEGDNQAGENKGGMVVYLWDHSQGARHEVGRVAFDRDESASPEITFEQALGLMIETAKAAVTSLAEYSENARRLS